MEHTRQAEDAEAHGASGFVRPSHALWLVPGAECEALVATQFPKSSEVPLGTVYSFPGALLLLEPQILWHSRS